RLDDAAALVESFRYTNEVYQEFQASKARPDAPYECLFMYSGGKDSTYMLDLLVNGQGRRVLSYTFNVPFESAHAAGNIERVGAKIPAAYLIDRDDDKIKRMMRHAFSRPVRRSEARFLDEKFPCISCRTFFVIRAIIHAYRHRIPYVVTCADPQQILTME